MLGGFAATGLPEDEAAADVGVAPAHASQVGCHACLSSFTPGAAASLPPHTII